MSLADKIYGKISQVADKAKQCYESGKDLWNAARQAGYNIQYGIGGAAAISDNISNAWHNMDREFKTWNGSNAIRPDYNKLIDSVADYTKEIASGVFEALDIFGVMTDGFKHLRNRYYDFKEKIKSPLSGTHKPDKSASALSVDSVDSVASTKNVDKTPALESLVSLYNNIIKEKNRSGSIGLDMLEHKLKKSFGYAFNGGIESVLQDALAFRISHNDSISSLTFDKRLITNDMKDYLMESYLNDGLTVSAAAKNFEDRFGMHINRKTLSKYARQLIMKKYKISKHLHSKAQAQRYVRTKAIN